MIAAFHSRVRKGTHHVDKQPHTSVRASADDDFLLERIQAFRGIWPAYAEHQRSNTFSKVNISLWIMARTI